MIWISKITSNQKVFKAYTRILRFIFTTECDYLVIGAGSAGCVVASHLAKEQKNKILILEAGSKDRSWKIHMPAALMYCLKNPHFSWCYHSVPQKNAGNRVMFQPRGKAWGGSSSINAMVYVRGHPMDYDRWEREGAKGWSYAECLPYFKRAQQHQLGPDDYRGGDGPLYVSRGKLENPLFNCFIQAGKEAGYGITEDFNGYKQEGFGPYDMTIKNGKRCSTSVAYLKHALKQYKNLSVLSNCHATIVLIEKSKAVGIEYFKGNELKNIKAHKEIIICCGAINTPQLLMLSGIGDAIQLREHGIPINSHLPGVGNNLQDHLETYLPYKCSQPITLYSFQWKFPIKMASTGIQWFLNQTGNAATNHLEAGAFIRTKNKIPHPDFQLYLFPLVVVDHGQGMPSCHAFQAISSAIRATSRGTVKIVSNNPFQHPAIDYNYLSTEEDIVDMRNCVKLTKEIFKQKSFEKYNKGFYDETLVLETNDQIDNFISKTCETSYHPCGTAKMGSETDKYAVIDSKCKVFGVDNLRIVDASIMPSIVSGNLNAPTIMMAEKASDIILNKPPLPKLEVPRWKPKSLNSHRE